MTIIDKLKKAFAIQLENGFFKLNEVDLENDMVEQKNAGYILSKKARGLFKVALCGGVFDILHAGHIDLLKDCKNQADFLVVVIARNQTVKEKKGTKAIFPECDRKEIINSIRYVDYAILGSEQDTMETIKKIQPNVIILGKDQKFDEKEIKKISSELACNIKVIRSEIWRNDVHAKSSRIKDKIKINHKTTEV